MKVFAIYLPRPYIHVMQVDCIVTKCRCCYSTQAAQLYLQNENELKIIIIIDLFAFRIIYSIKTI